MIIKNYKVFDYNGIVAKNIMYLKSSNLYKSGKYESMIIVVPKDFDADDNNNVFILSNNPRLTFAKVLNNLNGSFEKSISSVAIIKEFCSIGNNVHIGDYSVIGGEGFGYVKDHDGTHIRISNYGGVIIENHVDIGDNTCINRGTINDTIVGEGTKIDCLVHVGHNSIVGKNCLIAARSVIGGSTRLGDNCRIGIGTTIRQSLSIVDNVLLGCGSVVTKDIIKSGVYMGCPAKFYREWDGDSW